MPSKTITPPSERTIRLLRAWARVELSMVGEEFDGLTPSQWSAIYRKWELKEMRLDLRTARVCRAMAGGSYFDYMSPKSGELLKKSMKKSRRRFRQPSSSDIRSQLMALNQR